ncbi:S-adenosyl-L-methionine-dependent methyltransferase [Biscogniauxia mediterranea]|nr:S-adenosyl-L-methionine-dependent methyltransferase [Biscogniauxia mediterranea]
MNRALRRTTPLWRQVPRTGVVIPSSSSFSFSSSSLSSPWSPGQSRTYAFQAASPPTHQVFNRHTKWLQRERAAADVEGSRVVDYLKDEVAMRLCERLWDIKRDFPSVLDLGANTCNIARALTRPSLDPSSDLDSPPSGANSGPPLASRIGHLTAADSSAAQLYRDASLPFNDLLQLTREVLPDEETTLPYADDTFDLVLSSLSLHWINDLPGVLAQVNRVLKPDCAFMGAMLGGDTLYELRTSLQLAEQERRGGVSPRLSPLADVRDVGGLLQRAGFAVLTVDVDDIVVDYPDSFALMRDLQAMGEGNAVLGREMGPLPRDVLLAADAVYRALHGNPDGSLPATFRVIYMIGWKQSADQPRPLPRGSGELDLKDILENKK